MSLLEVRNLDVAYGGIQAVRGIDLDVAAGELACLIGANGAGKSSTLKAIMGLLHAGGEVRFDGHSLKRLATHEIVARGLILVPEGRGIFGRLTVAENLTMGAYLRHDQAGVRADLGRAFELFPILAQRRNQLAGTLSGGEQQMLAIARAQMGRPRLMLLDEPSMGLAPIMVQRIYANIRAIADGGVTLLLVEQNATMALEISHRAYVMESGEISLSGLSTDLVHDPQIRRAYLGE